VSDNISRAGSRIFPATPIRACLQAEKPQIQKSAFGGKKSPAAPVQKEIALFSIGRCQTDGITQAIVFFTANGGLFVFISSTNSSNQLWLNTGIGLPASSSNSVGVAIPQPRVAGEARYPG